MIYDECVLTLGPATETIASLIDGQRRDQEQMLRNLAVGKHASGAKYERKLTWSSELSNDIRGERLRFVEAMKEATTINVQSTHHLFLHIRLN